MLVSLRIAAWSGRLYDRKASNHVAAHHDASASAGRYNKCLLPKAAFAALTATMSACRTSHYAQTLPWDDQGGRLLTVANYERYTGLMDGLRERMVRERARFIEDYLRTCGDGNARCCGRRRTGYRSSPAASVARSRQGRRPGEDGYSSTEFGGRVLRRRFAPGSRNLP